MWRLGCSAAARWSGTAAWLAFFCAPGRLRFVDGHRARGDRVVASLADYAARTLA
jgi:hypothetical protein